MEEQHFSKPEIFQLLLFLGSITFIAGALFQLLFLLKQKRGIVFILLVIIITRLFSVVAASLLWFFWPFKFDVMFSFLFLPAFISEIILVPIMLKSSATIHKYF